MSSNLENEDLIANAITTLYESCMQAHRQGHPLFQAKDYDLDDLAEALAGPEPIVEVDNQFKLNQVIQKYLVSKAIRMNVADYHPQIDAIKVTDVSHINMVSQANCILSLEFKSGEKKHFFIKTGFEDEIRVLINRLPEENLEVVSKKQKRSTAAPKPKQFWSENWEEESQTKMHYDKINDDIILEKFEGYVLPLAQTHKRLCIMDVGGGKGRLGSKLIDSLINHQIPFKYILLEPAVIQCDAANYQFQRKYPVELQNKDIEIINLTLENFVTTEDYQKYQGGVDALILSGGPINQEIVWLKEAEENLSRLTPLLADQGIIIATGLSPLHFTGKDFAEKYDLQVLGTIKRRPTRNPYLRGDLHQCYVLQNSAPSPAYKPPSEGMF
nr:hypothetical protein [Legionella jordanis]